jgi:cytochrome c oxidase subunit 3
MPEQGPASLVAEQFDNLKQQHSVASLGMWVFLSTEVLFFGGLFVAYTIYRVTYPEQFALAGKELNITIGTINTAVLLTSSFFMALAVHAAKTDKSRKCAHYLLVTWLLGFSFMLLKAYEYYDDIKKDIVPGTTPLFHRIPPHHAPEPGRMLHFIYYAMTGLHATHLTIGLGIIAVMTVRAWRREFSSQYHSPIEVSGLYWHFVDIVWIFLYPLLYLMDRHS